MHWVEKASFEKIRRLLEISEQERHHEVLLTMNNFHDLSRHPFPYTVPIIPHPLPSKVVEGEHFVVADLLSLIPSGSSPARKAGSEATGRELVISTQSTQPSSTSEDSCPVPQAAKQVEGGGRSERPPLAIKDSRLTPQALKKKKGRRLKFAGVEEEDFISWVPPISRRSPDREEVDEEENEMSVLVHNFAARKRKRVVILEQAADAVPEVARGSSQPGPDGGSEVQAIIILGSPKTSLNDQPAMGNVTMKESREASPVPAALQVVHPPEEAIGRLDRAKYTQTGRRKPLLPDRMLVNSYLPPRGPAPPMEEVTVPRPEGAQEIVDPWGPSIEARFQLTIYTICTQ